MPNIKLQSSDEEIFDTDIQIVKCSGTIKIMLENCGMEDDENAIVPLPNVNSSILRKVLAWAQYHKDDPPPMEDDESEDNRNDNIIAWDVEFLKVDQGTLFELILAAIYLDIKGLLELTRKSVANMNEGKSAKEIRQTFNIKKDFTPAEENHKKNKSCEEK
ncbi:hypothetical protein KR084_003080 [Drosophila pseudotakahashii]|nr:hypothetical protein KR084_003080 [Drosophila pseudotakahashii]